MSAVEHMKTSQLTGCKTNLRRKEEFFVYTNMVSEIPIKETGQILATSKENGRTGGAGGGIIPGRRILYIFLSKEGDYSREAINRGTAIIRENTIPSTHGSFGIQGGQL